MISPKERVGLSPVEPPSSAQQLAALAASAKAMARKNWFLLGIFGVVFLGAMFPWLGAPGAPLYPEILTKYILVVIVFFLSGLSLKTAVLLTALQHWRFHVFFHLWVFAVVPLAMFAVSIGLRCCTAMNPLLVDGCLVLSTLASTVSSQALLTKGAGGSDALSIINAAATNLVGIFISPLLVLLFLGTSATVPFAEVVGSLLLTVVLPLCVGQIVQFRAREWLARTKPPTGPLSQCCLLVIMLFIAAGTFRKPLPVSGLAIAALLAVLLVLHAVLQVAVFLTAQLAVLHTTRGDVAAALFGCAHKSVAVGLPLIGIMYAGNPNIGLITIPLLLYHPMQIIAASFAVPHVKSWVLAAALPPADAESPPQTQTQQPAGPSIRDAGDMELF